MYRMNVTVSEKAGIFKKEKTKKKNHFNTLRPVGAGTLRFAQLFLKPGKIATA